MLENFLVPNISTIKRKFYSSCNKILGKTQRIDEITKLYLLEANCLPILTYAKPALDLKDSQIRELNVAWNSIYRKIFDFHVWESVTEFIEGLGKLNFKHMRLKLY